MSAYHRTIGSCQRTALPVFTFAALVTSSLVGVMSGCSGANTKDAREASPATSMRLADPAEAIASTRLGTHSLKDVWTASLATPPRDEFQTSADYRQRMGTFDSQRVYCFEVPRVASESGTNGAIVVFVADRQELTVRLRADPYSERRLTRVSGPSLTIEDTISTTREVGSTALGQRSSYSVARGDRYSLTFRNLRQFASATGVLFNVDEFGYPEVELRLPMDADAARLTKPSIKVLIGASLNGRERCEEKWLGSQATVSLPMAMRINERFAEGTLRYIVIIDARTEQVIAAFAAQ